MEESTSLKKIMLINNSLICQVDFQMSTRSREKWLLFQNGFVAEKAHTKESLTQAFRMEACLAKKIMKLYLDWCNESKSTTKVSMDAMPVGAEQDPAHTSTVSMHSIPPESPNLKFPCAKIIVQTEISGLPANQIIVSRKKPRGKCGLHVRGIGGMQA